MALTQVPAHQVKDETIKNADIAADAAISHSKLANISATSKILGRKTSGAGAIEELTIDETLAFLTDTTTNNVSTSKHGLVPKAPNDTTKFFRGDGTWDVAGGGGFDPTTTVEVMEEFLGGLTTTGNIGNYGWVFGGNGSVGGGGSSAGRFSCIAVNSGTSVDNGINLGLAELQGGLIFSGNTGNSTSIFSFANAQAANADSKIRIGLLNTLTASVNEPGSGVYLRALGTGNWYAVTRRAATETATDTGIAQSTSYKQFKIVSNSDGTSIAFYIDGVLKATHTTNIPLSSVLLTPVFSIVTTTTSEYSLFVDYFYMKITGLTR